MSEEFSPDKAAPFNMAMLFYYNLSKILMLKNEAFISGDYFGWYKGLKTVYRMIIFKVSKTKQEELDKLFIEAKNSFKFKLSSSDQPNYIPRNLMGTYREGLMEEIEDKLDRIDRELTKIMDQNKMIFPAVEITGGLAALEKRYKLGG